MRNGRADRGVVVMSLVVLLAASCARGDGRGDERAAAARILDGRERLGGPTVALARATLELEATLATARYAAPRGEGMRSALEPVGAQRRTVAERARAAALAAAGVDAPPDDPLQPLAEAVVLVQRAAAAALDAAAAAGAESEALLGYAAIDVAMDDVVATWSAPGSQTELRAALQAAATRAEELTAQAAALPSVPAACLLLRENRLRWAALLRERSLHLAGLARGSGGSQFDRAAGGFLAQPYGEERTDADARERPCWEDHSPVPRTGARLRNDVERLQSLLTDVAQPSPSR